jgi:hypothetical protein
MEDLYKMRKECETAESCISCRYSCSGECMLTEFIGRHLPRYWNLELLELTIKQKEKNKK